MLEFQRKRSRESLVPSVVYYTAHGGAHETQALNQPISLSQFTGSSESMEDTPHPHYSKMKRDGRIIMSDMRLQRWSRTASNGTFSCQFYPNWGDFSYTGDLVANFENATPWPTPLTVDQTAMERIAYVAALAKAKQATICGGEAIKDFKTTLTMLRRPFSGARDLIKKMRDKRLWKMKRFPFKSFARVTADTWLEERYGWGPLLMDIEAICMSLIERRVSNASVLRIARSGQEQARKQTSRFASQAATSPFGWLRGTGETTDEEYISANAGVAYRQIAGLSSSKMQQMFGMRIQDIPATLWECMPYSFVVDRFANCGTWLQAVTPSTDIVIVGQWVTTVYRRGRTVSCPTLIWTDGVHSGSGTAGTSTIKYTSVTRDCNPEIANTPELAPNVTALFAADAVSLLVNPVLGLLKNWQRR